MDFSAVSSNRFDNNYVSHVKPAATLERKKSEEPKLDENTKDKADKGKRSTTSKALICAGAAILGCVLAKKGFDWNELRKLSKSIAGMVQKPSGLDCKVLKDITLPVMIKAGLKKGDCVFLVPMKALKEIFAENPTYLKALKNAEFSENSMAVMFMKDGKYSRNIEKFIDPKQITDAQLNKLIKANEIVELPVECEVNKIKKLTLDSKPAEESSYFDLLSDICLN